MLIIINPFDTAIYQLPINGVDAYPCNRLLIIFGLLLDYLELLCYVSFQQHEPENEQKIK